MANINSVGVSKVIVSPDIGKGWIVERTGPRSFIATYADQNEAMARAREELALRGGELEVYSRAGQTDEVQTLDTMPKRGRANARG